jgi:hypothetical protein
VQQLLGLDWVTILYHWGGEIVSSVDASQWRRSDFKAGAAASDLGAAVMIYERFALCSLGCGWLSRAASWLECERWQVLMAIPKGGVGGPLGVVEQLDVGAAAPSFGSVEGVDLVSCGRRGFS